MPTGINGLSESNYRCRHFLSTHTEPIIACIMMYTLTLAGGIMYHYIIYILLYYSRLCAVNVFPVGHMLILVTFTPYETTLDHLISLNHLWVKVNNEFNFVSCGTRNLLYYTTLVDYIVNLVYTLWNLKKIEVRKIYLKSQEMFRYFYCRINFFLQTKNRI